MPLWKKRHVNRDFGRPYIVCTGANKKDILIDTEMDIHVNSATCVIDRFSTNYSLVAHMLQRSDRVRLYEVLMDDSTDSFL